MGILNDLAKRAKGEKKTPDEIRHNLRELAIADGNSHRAVIRPEKGPGVVHEVTSLMEVTAGELKEACEESPNKEYAAKRLHAIRRMKPSEIVYINRGDIDKLQHKPTKKEEKEQEEASKPIAVTSPPKTRK